jgi:GTP-binding protein
MKHGLPAVAIVGRPNVGKSSLFNLILKERKSIVDEMEGVTRDINIGKAKTTRSDFFLYDTAGYLEKGDTFNPLVQKKVKQAIGDTELILFMVDGRELHPFDKDLALFLKKQKKKVLLIVNKLDNRDMESLSNEFYELGFDEIIPFSVLHKRGLTTLIEKIEDLLENYPLEETEEEEIPIAIAGRPNAGKSLLLNTILGYDRSIVSEIPGTTRDSLDDIFLWQGKRIRLIDTAGLRRKSKIEGDIEYYSNVRTAQAIERSEVVIQLIDAVEGVSHQDEKIAQMVIEKGRSLVLAVNKWDLKKKNSDENYKIMEQFKKLVYNTMPVYWFVPIEFISAKENYKIEKLLQTTWEVYQNYHLRISTGKLNEWLTREIKESFNRKQFTNLKIYYVTQVFAAPPKFIFFVNKKEHIRKDYPRFLENRLRLAFEFTGVPIKITFREKNNEASAK